MQVEVNFEYKTESLQKCPSIITWSGKQFHASLGCYLSTHRIWPSLDMRTHYNIKFVLRIISCPLTVILVSFPTVRQTEWFVLFHGSIYLISFWTIRKTTASVLGNLKWSEQQTSHQKDKIKLMIIVFQTVLFVCLLILSLPRCI